MSSCIFYKEQYLFVSNARFSTLINFAIEVGEKMAQTSQEMVFVKQLQNEWTSGEMFSGCDLDLSTKFKSQEAKEFWQRAFEAVAIRIFRRELGNQNDISWQPSAICDAQIIARMLAEANKNELHN